MLVSFNSKIETPGVYQCRNWVIIAEVWLGLRYGLTELGIFFINLTITVSLPLHFGIIFYIYIIIIHGN